MCALLIGAVPAKAASDPLKGLIRLQVVARSNSQTDQAKKLKVRDRVRVAAVRIVRGAVDSDEAFARLLKGRLALQRAAGARVEIREVDCPLRVYGHRVVPAGRYRAVRVILGGGAGRNWWCVLYPDLCATDPLSAKALEGDEPVAFYSEVMRWVQAMRGNGS
jgi:stage II sporulation protein R